MQHRPDNCPLDKDELGNKSWAVLHTMAAKYPEKPTSIQQCDMKTFFNIFSKFYPCEHCAEDFMKELVHTLINIPQFIIKFVRRLKIDPPKVESQEALSQWLCRMHNKVNVKVGKEIFDCKKINERWRDGWLDGSCD